MERECAVSDEPKVVQLPTGYKPEQAPPDASEMQQLSWDITLLADEIKQLSIVLNKTVRAQVIQNNKIQEILKLLRK